MELNAEQRRAVEAVRGPVCILAGAGSGKTTTITHRIANQVATGAFAPSQILAVTFTDKAAGEMRARLEGLGVTGVRASTFHSAALSQLRYFRPDAVGKILASKALLRPQPRPNALPAPYKFRPAGDLATEIEWARNRRIPPARYLRLARRARAADPRRPDAPASTSATSCVKREQGLMDFEDLLERAIAAVRRRARRGGVPRALPRVHGRRVPGRQPAPADAARRAGSAPRDDLCVVGDDYQSIYGFTGATPEYLLGVPERFPHAAVIRLEENYRSTPQVLELANRLVPKLGGAEKTLRAVRPDGPEPEVRPFATAGGRGRVPRRADPRGRVPARGDRDPRAARTRGWPTSRRCSHEAGIPSPGRRAARARGGAPRSAHARSVARRPRRCGRSRSTSGWLAAPAGQARRARADAAERPRAARPAGGGGRRHRRGVPGRARAPLRRRRRRPARRPPAHLPRRQGPRVRARPAAAARGEGAALEARAHGRRRSTRSGGCSTSG